METKERGCDYAIRIAELVRFLRENGSQYPLEERLLSCGVAIGVALRGDYPGERDYQTAVKNIIEADYMIEMAAIAGYLSVEQTIHIRADGAKLLKQVEKEQKKVGK